MKRFRDRAAGLLLSTTMLLGFLMPAGCSKKNSSKQIQETTEQFIKAFGEGDADATESCVEEGFECDFKASPKEEVMLRMASRTEIREIVDIDVDKKANEAKAKVKISYIDAEDIVFNFDSRGLTKDQYFDLIDKTDLETKTLKFNFFYIPSEGSWYITKESAEKYKELFDFSSSLSMIMMSEADAKELFEEAFYHFAEGEFDRKDCPLDLSSIRYFDYCMADDEVVNEGAREFAQAYFKYIVDHGFTVETDPDNPYRATLKGYAPSKDEILAYVSSDECVEADYIVRMRLVSANRRDVQPDTLRSAIDADIYKNLAVKIPSMTPEEYTVTLSILVAYDISSGQTIDILGISIGNNYEMIIPIESEEAEEALERTPEQEFRCRRKACDDLLASGEILQEKYDIYMHVIERDEYIYAGGTVPEYEFIRNVEWEGTGDYINQAVDVVEVLPDYSDGQLLYGESEFDSNGYYIFYSREPGWLNTAGYYIDNDKVVVMLKYDNKFAKGTTLVYDWYIDDEEVGDSVFFTVEEDDTDEFVFEIPNMQIGRYSKYEFRLWEEDHMHVIAYVSLSQT